jgi:hypothetical protein
MTSDDGQTFLFHVRREDGSELMLGFPHSELPNMVECAATQMDKGRDDNGDKVATAFITGGFQVRRGPNGETVLSMVVGETGKIGFLLPPVMKAQLAAMLGRAETRH